MENRSSRVIPCYCLRFLMGYTGTYAMPVIVAAQWIDTHYHYVALCSVQRYDVINPKGNTKNGGHKNVERRYNFLPKDGRKVQILG